MMAPAWSFTFNSEQPQSRRTHGDSSEGWNSQTRGQSLLCIRAARCVPSSQAPLRESNFLLRSGE